MKARLLSFAFAGALFVAAAQASAQSSKNAVSLGAGVHPLGTAAPVVQYEYLLTDMISLGGKYLKLKYTWDDGSYHETGDGKGGEVIVTFYFQRQGYKGPYLTAGIGQFSVDWSWNDPTASPKSGSGNTKGGEASATFGWKIPLGKMFFIDPSVTLGDFFGNAKDSTGTKQSQLGAYGAAMLKAGVTF
jgi:hypothetical protein